VPDDFIRFDSKAVEQSIPERFAQQVANFSHHTAIKTRSSVIDYDALNKAANRIARSICLQTRRLDTPVAIVIEQGIEQIAAMLGVLKAGGFYVPLDTDTNFPVARIAAIVENSSTRLILTNTRSLELASGLATDGLQVLDIDRIDPSTANDDPAPDIAPTAIACLLYTSGTTGRPKGVVHTHRNVLHNIMRYTNTFRMGSSDRQTMLYSTNIYGGQRDMFGALLNGATLYPYPVKEEGVAGLAEWLAREEITVFTSVVTIFRHVLETLDGAQQFPALRLIKIGGEAAHRRDIEHFQARFDASCVLHSGLGLTEAGLVRNFFVDSQTRLDDDRVPLGFPAEGMEVLLVDKYGEQVPQGKVGEIVICSPYIAVGYWRRPDLNDFAFPNGEMEDGSRRFHSGDLGVLRPNGCLEHRGRKDFQVKIRGNRVETVEVEMALLSLPQIKEAVVVARKDSRDDNYLADYIVPDELQNPAINELRSELSK